MRKGAGGTNGNSARFSHVSDYRLAFVLSVGQLAVAMISRDTPFREVGPCSVDVWFSIANAVNSPIPASNLTLMHAASREHSALCLSQCVKESTLGRDQSAQQHRNPLGLMQSDGRSLLTFPSWEHAVEEWLRRIVDVNYKAGVYSPVNCSLEKFLVTYVGGPGCWTSHGDRCANDETWDGGSGGTIGLYIQQTVQRLNDYKGASMSNPYQAPIIHDLPKDYAKYGLTAGQASQIMSHKFSGRNGKVPKAIVLHIQDGTSRGSLNWWASGNAQASATVMANKDGTILNIIPESDGPWTNGDVQQPSSKGSTLLMSIGNANPNLVTLSIEVEGQRGDALTQAQHNAICWKVTDWMIRYGLGVSDVYRHADFNSVTRPYCPGPLFDQVMATLSSGGQPVSEAWPGKPKWLPDELVTRLFPEATPQGPRTQAWLKYCSESGRAPHRVAFWGSGANQLIEFSDGTLIDAKGKVLGRD